MQVKRVRCESSGVLVAKDKAIKRFIVRNIVDASAIRDIQDSSVIDGAHCRALCRRAVMHYGHAETSQLCRRLCTAKDLQEGVLLRLGSHPLQGGARAFPRGQEEQGATQALQARQAVCQMIRQAKTRHHSCPASLADEMSVPQSRKAANAEEGER